MAENYNPIIVDVDNPTLEYRLTKVPLSALRPTARKRIALFLDIESDIIQKEIGRLRDWRGLAELAAFSNLEIMKFGRSESPTLELLIDWEINKDYTPSLGDLWLCLLQLDRKDIMLECKNIIERDAKSHIAREQRLADDYIPVQEDIISSSTHVSSDHYVNETRFLTVHDAANPDNLVIYDAFICYNSDSKGRDGTFVKECEKQLEITRGIKLCIPERDCLIGGAKYICDAELIKSRCRRMIIVVSHEFLHSPACDFQVKFAHSLEPGARKKRLIPVLLEERLPIPDILRHVTMCDFTKPDLMEWIWDRLACSIRAPLDAPEDDVNQFKSPCIPKTLNKSSSKPFFRSSARSSTDSSNSSVSMTSLESLDTDSQEQKEERHSKVKSFISRIQNFVKR